MKRQRPIFDTRTSRLALIAIVACLTACEGTKVYPVDPDAKAVSASAQADSARRSFDLDSTGIPIASSFQYPIDGFTHEQFGFCFGGENDSFPKKRHLGCDTRVDETPYGTAVVAPADGVVRISTDFPDGKRAKRGFGAYGSDSSKNENYYGCLIVLEHMLQEGGQAVTSLVGHIQCESIDGYDENERIGNPSRDSLVKKGQYIGHVNSYWHGAGTDADWHHVHFGIRRGRFRIGEYKRDAELLAYVRGYAPSGDFTYDDIAARYRHDDWIDPIEFIEAHQDPETPAPVLRHPSGSLLRAPGGGYWQVINEREAAPIPKTVFTADRFDASGAVDVSLEEIGCYAEASPIEPLGPWTIYRKPFTKTVSIAYHDRGERFDFIRWEAFTSWGFTEADIDANPVSNGMTAEWYESFYNPEGKRLLRSGALVKGDAESEVSIVSVNQERIPIANGDVFERLGFEWSSVVTIPQEVLTDVAGPRSSVAFGLGKMTTCAVPYACAGGGICGGGGEVDAPESGDLEPLLDGASSVSDGESDSENEDADQSSDSSSESDDSASRDTDATDTEDDSNDESESGAFVEIAAASGCEPYSSASCPCLVGSTVVDGYQVCAADGRSYGECVCGAASQISEETLETESASDGESDDLELDGVIADNSSSSADADADLQSAQAETLPASEASANNEPAVATAPSHESESAQAASPDGSDGAAQSTDGSPETVTVDEAPDSSGDSGSSETSTDGSAVEIASTSTPAPSSNGGIRLVYVSPICGAMRIEAWWTDIAGKNRAWGPIDCADANPLDCVLDCALAIPSGTPYFEFQVFLPNGEGYGNEDCYNGGCGAPLGELHLYRGSNEVAFSLTPNPDGPPYFNEVLQPVP